MGEMNLKPLSDRVIVEPLERAEVTALGIVLPETAKEKPQKGKILAVGPGKADDKGKVTPIDVEAGDVILFAKYGGTEIKLDSGDTVLVLRESDILAVVEE